MPTINTKISKKYRYFFYLTLMMSVISGSGFWLLRRFGMVEGDFGPESHALQYPLLQLHGFAAFIMLMCLGAIFASHVPKTWYTGRAKRTGITLSTAVMTSMLSAYALYYLVSQDWHELLGNIHAVVGLGLPLMLFVHVTYARKSRRSSGKRGKNSTKQMPTQRF